MRIARLKRLRASNKVKRNEEEEKRKIYRGKSSLCGKAAPSPVWYFFSFPFSSSLLGLAPSSRCPSLSIGPPFPIPTRLAPLPPMMHLFWFFPAVPFCWFFFCLYFPGRRLYHGPKTHDYRCFIWFGEPTRLGIEDGVDGHYYHPLFLLHDLFPCSLFYFSVFFFLFKKKRETTGQKSVHASRGASVQQVWDGIFVCNELRRDRRCILGGDYHVPNSTDNKSIS